MLSRSHYLVLLRVGNAEARAWYEREASRQGWSMRTLQRNVDTLYYDRLLMSQVEEPVVAAKYQLYLPSEEELRAEIENQKALFALQRGLEGE
ncbi:DUF1016 N-terminal domain-containing protein [Rubneribacter badeniensis]|uniref:DUF1016 N-terminal domain-containing protein n=1 Tax=Rubneribacter badeniensis TaxID=2070688 RepID=UPI003A8E5F3D